jgi:hypothetical protein
MLDALFKALLASVCQVPPSQLSAARSRHQDADDNCESGTGAAEAAMRVKWC